MRRIVVIVRLAVALGAAVSLCAHAQPSQCVVSTLPVTEFGIVVEDGRRIVPGIRPLNWNDANQEVRYVRALIAPSAPAGTHWHLTIRDAFLRPLETFSSATVGPGDLRWTRRLDASVALHFDLVSASPNTFVEIKRTIVMPAMAQNPYYSVQDLKNKRYLEIEKADTQFRPMGDSVGMVMAHWGGVSWCCSGVAVGPDLLLTNWHCGGIPNQMPESSYWSPQVCANTIIDLSWDGDNSEREFLCSEVIAARAEEDFALLRIRPRRGDDPLRLPAIRRKPVQDGEPLTMIHHAACRSKLVSNSCSAEKGVHPSWRGNSSGDFSHKCDTEQGSSGAPVFDLNGRLLGLHHLGFQIVEGKCDRLNKGIRIEAILPRIPEAERNLLQGLVVD